MSKVTAHWRPQAKMIGAAVFVVLCLIPCHLASTYGANNFMANDVGTSIQTMKMACIHGMGDNIAFTVYPTIHIKFQGTRQQICTKSVQAFVLQREHSLGLAPSVNGLVPYPGSTTSFTQTFVSPENSLDGINLYIANYAKTPQSNFRFILYDDMCRRELTQSTIVGNTVRDNQLHEILFPEQANSAGRSYCFTVEPISKNGISPIALRLTAPNMYQDGQAIIQSQPVPEDVVFSLLYAVK